MKNINQIIEIDTKWLWHFLKEKHLTKQFIGKLYNVTDTLEKPKTLKQLLENNINRSEHYIYGFRYESNEYTLFNNENLLSNSKLFAAWYCPPFIFNPRCNIFSTNFEEAHAWRNIKNNYLDLKYILSYIIK